MLVKHEHATQNNGNPHAHSPLPEAFNSNRVATASSKYTEYTAQKFSGIKQQPRFMEVFCFCDYCCHSAFFVCFVFVCLQGLSYINSLKMMRVDRYSNLV